MADATTRSAWKSRQRRMNHLVTHVKLKGVAPLRVDGVAGHSTRQRIKDIKYWLGWGGPRSSRYTAEFHNRLGHPYSRKYSPASMIREGIRRRRHHNRAWQKSHDAATATSGVTTFDGVAVAAVAVKYLRWARAHGWRGRLVSGYRTPAYSESLCYRMCGAPRCPGRCAGRSTNHAWALPNRFAVDVSDYGTFGRVIRGCPYSPRIYNILGAKDPVHFSPSGQ